MKKSIFQSSNFWTNVFTIILSVFFLNGVEIPVDSPENLAQAFVEHNWAEFVGLILVNLANPIYHIFKKKPDNFWSFLKSVNFWVNVMTLGISVAVFFGIQIPENTGRAIIDLITSGDINSLVLLVFTNIVNPIYHFFKSKQEVPEVA